MNFMTPQKSKLLDFLFKCFIYLFSFITLISLFFMIFFIVSQGVRYFTPLFFVRDAPFPIGDTDFFKLSSANMIEAIGGIRNSLIGMLIIVFFASSIAIPFGIAIAIYLSENQYTKLSYLTLLCVDSIQGIPSIIFGIIANIWIVLKVKAYSGLAGSFALMIIMLPIIIKNSYETLILIPKALKESALALGVPHNKMLTKIVLPSAMGGISSGILLSISRILGETAPLLFTAFGNPYMTLNIFGPMETIAMQIYKNSTAPNANLIANAWASSLALVLIILLLNLIVKPMIDKFKIKF